MTTTITNNSAQRRAIAMTAMMLLALIVAIRVLVADWSISAPLVIFYFFLVFNTFFSIRYFAPYESPTDLVQVVFDVLLVTLYFCLAAAIATPILFSVTVTALLTLAMLKYLVLQYRRYNDPTINRKIKIDGLSAIIMAVWAGSMFAGFETLSSWMMAVANVIFNIYLLWIKPLYPYPPKPRPQP